MKLSALKNFRRKLAADEAVYGLWVTLESPTISEMAVAMGIDWIVVDAEHGHLDWGDIVAHIRSTIRSNTVVLVRIAELNGGLIKRALDCGADGVVVPWIETAEQLRAAVSFAKYPPEGVRGIGGERGTAWGRDVNAKATNDSVLVVPIIETVTAGKNIAELCAVPGVDVMYFGPADYSSTAGYAGQWEGPGVAEQLLAIKDTIRASGKQCGVVCTSSQNLIERQQQGFRMLCLGLDATLFLNAMSSSLAAVGRSREVKQDLSPG